jgi:uncharacterized membrane protein
MLVGWLIVAAMFAGSSFVSTQLIDKFPERVPNHWDIHGQADGWASRDNTFEFFYLFPTMTAGMMALALVLPWLSPAPFKVETFRRTYDYVFALVAGLFAWMHASFLYIAATNSDFRWTLAGLFLFFALLGNVLGKVRKNFWVGVRTPWTLANDIVWEKTHRFAAWFFTATGLIGFVACLAGLNPWWCFVLVIGSALVTVVYSLVIYKQLERRGQLQLPVDGDAASTK